MSGLRDLEGVAAARTRLRLRHVAEDARRTAAARPLRRRAPARGPARHGRGRGGELPEEARGKEDRQDQPGGEEPGAAASDAADSPAPAGSPSPAAASLTSGGTRPAFRPVTIRTAQDARTAAAEYLRWLGFPEVRVTEKRPASGVDVRGAGIIAHVDPTTAPTTLREVETLWLNGLNEEVATACFSLAGYSREARTRADSLSVPLFVLDLTGMPQAVNDPADDLIRSVC